LLQPHGVDLPTISDSGSLLRKLTARASAYREHETARRDRGALLAARETARIALEGIANNLMSSLEGS
jgi:hypothetical protein